MEATVNWNAYDTEEMVRGVEDGAAGRALQEVVPEVL